MNRAHHGAPTPADLPDPTDPVDVLAFVLCPPQVFAPATAREDELDAVREAMRPAKEEAVRRWLLAAATRQRS